MFISIFISASLYDCEVVGKVAASVICLFFFYSVLWLVFFFVFVVPPGLWLHSISLTFLYSLVLLNGCGGGVFVVYYCLIGWSLDRSSTRKLGNNDESKRLLLLATPVTRLHYHRSSDDVGL